MLPELIYLLMYFMSGAAILYVLEKKHIFKTDTIIVIALILYVPFICVVVGLYQQYLTTR